VCAIVQPFAETENLRLWSEPDFLVFDWAPLSFVYRKGEIEPPHRMADLLDSRFKSAIALEDPRTSTPGLEFMFWVLDEMGIEEGFTYLKSLQPQLHSVSASWSTAYGLFTQKQAQLAFSYATSPIYHEVEEKNSQYAAAVFDGGHVAQFEYAGIPTSCDNCAGAEIFLKFLVQPEIQKIIMQKNYMFPVIAKVIDGTAFEHVPKVTLHRWKNLPELLKRRDELLKRWQEIGM
jgi:thiamine transport system substrate-binding protein